MIYSPSIEILMSIAAQEAQVGGHGELLPEHLVMALTKIAEMDPAILGKLLVGKYSQEEYGREVEALRGRLVTTVPDTKKLRRELRARLGKGPGRAKGGLHRSEVTRTLFVSAEKLVQADTRFKSVTLELMLIVILIFPPTPLLLEFLGKRDNPEEMLMEQDAALEGPGMDDKGIDDRTRLARAPMDLPALTARLKEMRAKLLDTVFGQDQAVHAFVEGLFNAEVVAASDAGRKRPKALFVFAGPPGTGKTFLAESGVEVLGLPFKRFDMSGFSDRMGVVLLAGAQRSYQDAKEGQLTAFVKTNPKAVLLFDEIEKAGADVIHLFLQLLDNGALEDKFTEENVSFKDTVIIFTTNAGRSLYNDPNSSGIGLARGGFHRKTILNALETDKDPRTGRRFFPGAICSRLATGYPVMFNHLGVNELERIAAKELNRVAGLMAEQYGLRVELGPAVPLCLVMREGVRTDARTVRSQAESFLKSEMFKFASLYEPERLKSVLESASRMVVDLEPDQDIEDKDISGLLAEQAAPGILVAASPEKAFQVLQAAPHMDATAPLDVAGAKEALAMGEFDFALLDLWFDSPVAQASQDPVKTVMYFDHVPMAARSIHNGQELLRHIHEYYPDLPVYLLSIVGPDGQGRVDEELMLACSRSGGARGVIEKQASDESGAELARRVQEVGLAMHRERQAAEFGSQSKALAFDTAPGLDQATGDIRIRLRNLAVARAVSAEDLDAMVSDAERPTTLFQDVFGADQAKSELGFIVDWLRDPRKFASLDIKPPRGILMYGPPGTGKTMLARALAGESSVNFIAESASNFVTKYVGSGPENIRNLFRRARRYAPSILFIDEIDAIGKKRSGGEFNRPQEETLNSLLTEMDGFSTSPAKPVIVLAATNLVESLDTALVRRFDREVEVDKPDRAAREAYLRKRLQGAPGKEVGDEVIARVGGQSAGMTIAQLERVVRFAGRAAAMQGVPVSDAILEEAFETMRMGDSKGPAADPDTLLRVARHEAGHCLAGWLRGEKPVQITIVARGKAGGYVEREANEDRMVYLKTELEGMIRQAMAGRAAEIVYYGPESGLSSGVSGDLETATHWAGLMVRQFGMSADMGHIALDARRIGDGPLADKVAAAVERIVAGQLEAAVRQLEEHRATMDLLVDKLMEKNRLTREELEVFMPEPE